MSFYECLKAYPEGSASASRLALTAKRLGYHGLIICNQEPDKVFRREAADGIKGIHLIMGVEVKSASTRALRSRILAQRARYPFLVIQGTTEETIRATCEDPNVDLLLLPRDDQRPFTIASARAAKLNRVAIGFDLSPLLRLRGRSRARWMGATKRNLILARKFDLALVITVNARSHLDLRAPRDLLALAETAGFDTCEAAMALALPGRLVELNRKKWLGPGVELL